MLYRIRVKDHLDRGWSEWFEGMTITHESNGETVMVSVRQRPTDQRSLLSGSLTAFVPKGTPRPSLFMRITSDVHRTVSTNKELGGVD